MAWDVSPEATSLAAAAANAAGWISLPVGQAPDEDQIARCTSFSAAMAEVCDGFLKEPVQYEP